ncbi:uncharacterized protein [Paramisgurnus dabryanus]|uniref:uncharacterized protein n=1 Tax=Paramisgurnus dabryanus TaxID=90735 RepID=UPI0031F44BEE
MEVPRLKKRPRRFCEHCDNELCHTQYFDHRKRYFKNGVWEKKNKRASSDNVQSLLISSHEPAVSVVPSMWKDLEENFTGLREIDESEMNSEDMAGRRLAFSSPSSPLHGRDQPLSSSPLTDESKLLNALSGLSRQLDLLTSNVNEQFANVNEQFAVVNSRLLSMEERLAALESKNCNVTVKENNSKKRRLVHNPNIAEDVRRLHNSEANCRRYVP